MKVGELIKQLEGLSDDSEVLVVSPDEGGGDPLLMFLEGVYPIPLDAEEGEAFWVQQAVDGCVMDRSATVLEATSVG